MIVAAEGGGDEARGHPQGGNGHVRPIEAAGKAGGVGNHPGERGTPAQSRSVARWGPTKRQCPPRPCAHGHGALGDERPAGADAGARQGDRREDDQRGPRAASTRRRPAGPPPSSPDRPPTGDHAYGHCGRPATAREVAVQPREAPATHVAGTQRVETMQDLEEDRHEDLQRAVGDRHQQGEPPADAGGRAQRKGVTRQRLRRRAAIDAARYNSHTTAIVATNRPIFANGDGTTTAVSDGAGDRGADQGQAQAPGHARAAIPVRRRAAGVRKAADRQHARRAPATSDERAAPMAVARERRRRPTARPGWRQLQHAGQQREGTRPHGRRERSLRTST